MIQQILDSEIGYLMSFTKHFYGHLLVSMKFPHWYRTKDFEIKGNVAKFLYWEFFGLLYSDSVSNKKVIYKALAILSKIIKENQQ